MGEKCAFGECVKFKIQDSQHAEKQGQSCSQKIFKKRTTCLNAKHIILLVRKNVSKKLHGLKISLSHDLLFGLMEGLVMKCDECP